MQKQNKPALSSTSLSAAQTLNILLWVNPDSFNPFWLPALHSCLREWWPGSLGVGLLVRSISHSPANMCLCLCRHPAATCALSQHLKRCLLYLLSAYSIPIPADGCVPLPILLFSTSLSLCLLAQLLQHVSETFSISLSQHVTWICPFTAIQGNLCLGGRATYIIWSVSWLGGCSEKNLCGGGMSFNTSIYWGKKYGRKRRRRRRKIS